MGWIFVCATLQQSPEFVSFFFRPVEITWEGELHSACQADYWILWLQPDLYNFCYFAFRVFFIHLCPCVSLIVLNIMLLRAMWEAGWKRRQLVKDNYNMEDSEECRRLMDSYSTTLMIFVVITVFLVVHVPYSVLIILQIISIVFNEEFLSYHVLVTFSLMSYFLINVSYPINFAVYCGISKKFRKTLKELFVLGAGGDTKDRSEFSRYSILNEPDICTNETTL